MKAFDGEQVLVGVVEAAHGAAAGRAACARRARDSSRPRAARVSSMPGLMVLPVMAARTGWATWPSFLPWVSAKVLRAALEGGGGEVGGGEGAREFGEHGLVVAGQQRLGFRLDGCGGADEECCAVREFDQGLRTLFQAGHELEDAGAGGSSRQAGGFEAGDDLVGQAVVIGGAEIDAVHLHQLGIVHAPGGAADGRACRTRG